MLIALTLTALPVPARPMTAEITRDAITDRVSATATLRADRDRLVIGCDPGRVRRLWIHLDSALWFRRGNPYNGNIALTHRFDDQPARRMMWSVRDARATLVGIDRVRRFVDALAASDRLVIRARDVEGASFDITFQIVDAEPAIARVREACPLPPRRWFAWPWQ